VAIAARLKSCPTPTTKPVTNLELLFPKHTHNESGADDRD
jgi:hypothetical protein